MDGSERDGVKGEDCFSSNFVDGVLSNPPDLLVYVHFVNLTTDRVSYLNST